MSFESYSNIVLGKRLIRRGDIGRNIGIEVTLS
jgi:hypothetical protein